MRGIVINASLKKGHFAGATSNVGPRK